MTGKQENKYSMYLAFKKYIDTQTAITNTIPNFGAIYTLFVSALGKIEANRNVQETDNSGTTQTKQETRDSLVASAFDLSKKLKAFGTVSKNNTLLAEVDTTLSRLNAMADTTLHDKATLFYNRAQANIGNLTAYNVTAASQTAYGTLLGNYKNLIPAPRLSQNDRKEATKNLTAGFTEADSALETLDTLIEVVRLSNPTFYSKYQAARTIINLGKKKVALNGKATDLNGNGIANVSFQIVATSTLKTQASNASPSPVIQKKTSKKGIFRLGSLAAGTYTVTISKPGYKPQTIVLNQVEGEASKLYVVLEAE